MADPVKVRLRWTENTQYECDVEVNAEEWAAHDGGDRDEMLITAIVELDAVQLGDACTGVSEREIDSREVIGEEPVKVTMSAPAHDPEW